ncbi:hypothetical protein LINPERPRIM_LOCUS28542 [Linum perenne]
MYPFPASAMIYGCWTRRQSLKFPESWH